MQRRRTWGLITIVALALGLLPCFNAVQAQAKKSERPAAEKSAPAAPGPYKAVAITLPESLKDKSFETFRNELAGIAERKDKAALAKLIQKDFFWERQSGNGADPKKSGMANFAAAIGLDNGEDADGAWEVIAIYAEDPTAFQLSDKSGVICGPADPNFDENAFQALLESTKTDISDWLYPIANGVEMRAAPRANAAVAEKVGLTFVRAMPSDAPPDAANSDESEYINVMLPSGKTGFVRLQDLASLSISQICYIKDGEAWKIAGVLGGME
jgi:hypothetical protein